jgi:hypothetical protein
MKIQDNIFGNKDPFEKCLYLIGYYLHEDRNAIAILTDANFDILTKAVNPFVKDLNYRLLKYETQQGKRDFLRFVIMQFYELQYFWKTNFDLISGTSDTTITGQKRDEFSKYIFLAYELFNILMNEIQIACITFKIDFYNLCDELYFNTNTFDSGLTFGFKEMQPYNPEEKGKSFTWTGNHAQKEALCEALRVAGYIDQGTTKEAFTAIFAGELKQCEPIRWHGSNRLLAYLFSQMNSGNKPLILSREWQSIIENYRLFKNKTGKNLTAGDLSTALSNINDEHSGGEPKGFEKIDAILKNIKTLNP